MSVVEFSARSTTSSGCGEHVWFSLESKASGFEVKPALPRRAPIARMIGQRGAARPCCGKINETYSALNGNPIR